MMTTLPLIRGGEWRTMMSGTLVYASATGLGLLGVAGVGKAIAETADVINADGKLLIPFGMAVSGMVAFATAVWIVGRYKAKQDRHGRAIRGIKKRMKENERLYTRNREEDMEESRKFRHEMRGFMFSVKLKLGIQEAVQVDREHRKEGSDS